MTTKRPQPIIWPAHLEPTWPQRKPLIINVATGWLTREQNPSQPYTPEEIASEVIDAYQAGASVWHIHVRDAETGSLRLTQEERVELHQRTCDLVFRHCPDIITDPSAADPMTDDSVEARITPYFGTLVEADPHYADMAVLNMGTMSMGPWERQWVFVNRLPALLAHARALEGLGVKPEFVCYDMPMIEDTKEHIIGEVKKPWYFSLCQGIHNTEPPKLELTKVLADQLPPGDVVWQAIMGGRNWLPLTVQAILLGCDAVRVGKEDTIYLHPDRDVNISRCSEVVEKVANIAGELGRKIATPREAREKLGLRQIG